VGKSRSNWPVSYPSLLQYRRSAAQMNTTRAADHPNPQDLRTELLILVDGELTSIVVPVLECAAHSSYAVERQPLFRKSSISLAPSPFLSPPSYPPLEIALCLLHRIEPLIPRHCRNIISISLYQFFNPLFLSLALLPWPSPLQ